MNESPLKVSSKPMIWNEDVIESMLKGYFEDSLKGISIFSHVNGVTCCSVAIRCDGDIDE